MPSEQARTNEVHRLLAKELDGVLHRQSARVQGPLFDLGEQEVREFWALMIEIGEALHAQGVRNPGVDSWLLAFQLECLRGLMGEHRCRRLLQVSLVRFFPDEGSQHERA